MAKTNNQKVRNSNVSTNISNFYNRYGFTPDQASYRTVSGGYGIGNSSPNTLVSGANTQGTPGEVFIQTYGPPSPGTPAYSVQSPTTQGPDTPAVGPGGTSTAQTYQPNLVEYPPGSGFYYDLNNPTERQGFYDRRLTDLQQSRDQQISTIDQNIADLVGSSKDYVTNYFNQLGNFNTVKGQGDMNRIDTYSQASPNAFQSSEGNSYDLANNNYLTGVAQAADKANQDVGGAYLANPNDPSLLGADTTYGRQQQNYFAGRNDVGRNYNDYLAGIVQQNDPSTNPFRYDYQAQGLQAPGAVDISAYNPFVDFKTVSGQAQAGPNFRPVGGRQFTNETPLQNFLGTTQLNPHDTNYLRNYLIGNT